MPGPLENINGILVPKVIQVHVPWFQAEICNMVTSFLNIRDEPARFKEQLETIIEAYNPTWVILNQLLNVVCPKGIWVRLKEKATWPTYQPDLADLIALIRQHCRSVPH